MLLALIFVVCLIYYFCKYYSQTKDMPLNDEVCLSALSNLSDKDYEETSPKSDTINVHLKQEQIDTSRIVEYTGVIPRQFEFRPYDFKTFIGQKEAKNRAYLAIKKINKGLRANMFIDGRQGVGKTSFVKIVAKMLNANLIIRVGKQIDEEELIQIINEINTSPVYSVFFCDEMDSMEKTMIKELNPIIEEYKIKDKQIKPFMFVGASIQKHILLKYAPDTMDRIQIHLKFERYTIDELEQIINQYIKQLFPEETIADTNIHTISSNAKYTPRIGISLAEEFVVLQDIEQVLKNWKIIKNGLTEIDIRVLEVLNDLSRPIGSNALAQRCKLTETEYSKEIEPFLCEEGYILRVPSRIISPKGKLFLRELK